MTGIVLFQIYLIIKKDKRQKLIETVFSVEPKGTSLRRLIHPSPGLYMALNKTYMGWGSIIFRNRPSSI